MAYKSNPFLERMSERTTSDQEFVRLFSPKILERLAEDAFDGAVHIFRSAPGGGKTTLLRAFTPAALRAFWNARRSPDMSEVFQRLVAQGVLDEHGGPQLLGVLLSCASGYADLPAGAPAVQDGLFRSLLDCRVVLRTLRNLGLLLGLQTHRDIDSIRLRYDSTLTDLKQIPLTDSPLRLLEWAEQRERDVYSRLDSVVGTSAAATPDHIRLESVLWLQGVEFIRDGRPLRLRRLLMIDDLHKLRRRQRRLLIDELAELRATVPVWLAERNIALGDELLSQGVREGREIRYYPLEEMWSSSGRHHQFALFAQNVLDRRLNLQEIIPTGSFSQYLRVEFRPLEVDESIRRGIEHVHTDLESYRPKDRYVKWLAYADQQIATSDIESLRNLYVTVILLARDQAKRQLALDLAPLPTDDLEERDSPQVQAAADIFMHEDLQLPYYFGIDRLCTMATNNIEEALGLAAVLYDALQAKRVLRKPDLQLAPSEQEKLLTHAAKLRRDFIPKNHTAGTQAQRLLDGIGIFCRSKTFTPTAPYAPGVTGVRLTSGELARLSSEHGPIADVRAGLRHVIAECVAENLLIARPSSASTSRDPGSIFYLNRTLCAHYGLPLQTGGWQDVLLEDLLRWLEGSTRARQPRLSVQ